MSGWNLQHRPWTTPSRILSLSYPGLSLRCLKGINKIQFTTKL